MKISGFTFVRNGETLGYPVAEAIKSVLPVCDEFVIALGKGDDGDGTEALIREINDPKIKIIDTVWPSREEATGAKIYSDQTNIALDACTGDWCLYIQCDEVIHEKYLGTIKAACEAELHNTKVEGFLFKYKHFWGDYDHYQVNHRNYPFEVRLVRNNIGATSVGDAQSFRITPEMRKPYVIEIDAEVFHYGYVRHPFAMMRRTKAITVNYHGAEAAAEMFKDSAPDFEYGSLEKIHRYDETTPAVMRDAVSQMNWGDLLTYRGESRIKQPHETGKERFRDFVESRFFGRRQPWGYRCYKRLAIKQYRSVELTLPQPTRPEISLIIAVYKRPEALEMIFEALVKQTFTDFEIVISDDGSGDEIPELIAAWKDRFSFPIQHIWHTDDGFRKTIIINKAVQASRGEYLVSIDGDCIPHSRFLQDHWERREHGAVLAGRRVMMSEKATEKFTADEIRHGSFEKSFRWISNTEKSTTQYAFRNTHIDNHRNKKRDNYFVLGSNFSIFRKDFLKLNGYDERIIGRGMEDNNLHARIQAAGMPIRSISQVALQYHLFHNADPIPHDEETVKQFCTVDSGWTEFGIVKEKEIESK